MDEPEGANLPCELELAPLLDREPTTTGARPAATVSKMLAVLHAPVPSSPPNLNTPSVSLSLSQLRLGLKEPPRPNARGQ